MISSRKSCKALIRDADSAIEEMGKKLHQEALDAIAGETSKSMAELGTVHDIQKRGSGRWSEGLKVEHSTSVQLMAEHAETTLLEPKFAKKIAELIKSHQKAQCSCIHVHVYVHMCSSISGPLVCSLLVESGRLGNLETRGNRLISH